MSRLKVAAALALVLLWGPAGPVGAIDFIQDQDDRTTSGQTVQLDVPHGSGERDLLVAMVAYLPVPDAVLTAPAGWTHVSTIASGDAITQSLYYRVAGPAEPRTYTWTYSEPTTMAGASLAYEGVDTATPLAASATVASSFGPQATLPAFTVPVANSVIVLLYAAADKTVMLSPPTGYTSLVRDFSTRGEMPGITVEVAERPRTAAGPEGPLTVAASHDAPLVVHALALRPPAVSFARAATAAPESTGTYLLEARLSAPTGTPIDFGFAVTGGTAVATDYNVQAATITFAEGATVAYVPLRIVADDDAEPDETMEVSLTASSEVILGDPAVAVHTIGDDDTNYRFTASAATVVESAGSYTATVERLGLTGGAGSVVVQTAGGGASSGHDFTGTSASLSFAPGETSKTFLVAITADTEPETDETLELKMSSPTGGTLAQPSTLALTILDDDTVASVAADPVAADGTPMAGARWGEWVADTGAAHVGATNFLKLTNAGTRSTQPVLVDFVDTGFRGLLDPTEVVPLDGAIQFAWWEDTTPEASRPDEGTYTFGAPSPTGSLQVSFSGRGHIIYVTYRLTAIPSMLADQAYESAYRIS